MLGEREQLALIHAMQTLPINQRAVVELKFFGQFTFVEIAQQLNASQNTIKARLYSALHKLKGEMTQAQEGNEPC
jgi:RNA polymerase sigma-70 factor (ECF subfamily)